MNDDYYKKIFSSNLRYYMELNGKTQVDLINDLHINKSSISTWVNGTRLPRMDKVDMLAQYFHINRSNLIEEKTFEPIIKSINSVTDNEYDHIKKYRDLDDHGKDMVDTVLVKEYDRCISILKEPGSVAALPEPPHLMPRAAHQRTDIQVTEEMIQHDDDLMEDDSIWNK